MNQTTCFLYKKICECVNFGFLIVPCSWTKLHPPDEKDVWCVDGIFFNVDSENFQILYLRFWKSIKKRTLILRFLHTNEVFRFGQNNDAYVSNSLSVYSAVASFFLAELKFSDLKWRLVHETLNNFWYRTHLKDVSPLDVLEFQELQCSTL